MSPDEWKNQQALLLPKESEKKFTKGTGELRPADLEDVLAKSVGEWGWFQTWIGVIFFYCQATMAPGVYGALFTDYTPKHYCVKSQEVEFNMTVWDSLETQERRCGESCQEWVFDRSVFQSTASSDFNIVCDKAALKTLSNTFRMSGLAV